jgi:hypothetical protein
VTALYLRKLSLLIILGCLLALTTAPASASPALQEPDPPPPEAEQLLPTEQPLPTAQPPAAGGEAQPQTTFKYYLPLVTQWKQCQATGEIYGDLSMLPPPTDRPAENHADLNLFLRNYERIDGVALGLVNYGGGIDVNAPQLRGLFSPFRLPTFTNTYRVNHWFWAPPPDPGTRGPPITDWPTTLIGMAVTPGELIRAPYSGYDIGGGMEVMVLYAAANRITLSYTREDSIAFGYAIHVENICVDPNLVALYQARNASGRGRLPALQAGEAFGRAAGTEIGVAIRDRGAFMDPRSRKDWWQNY